ncbi:Uncharacterised protein [Mycoplasmopsis edwardii]|uniref:Uncharacterized protein n=1 Tax=Mycoplasmopsis edwardii TaxID=53558 RepID=A0A3B0QCE8_9BACT|nr:Uncharacterised protein [Mycoplasmopsis edwardii]
MIETFQGNFDEDTEFLHDTKGMKLKFKSNLQDKIEYKMRMC